MQMLAQQPGSLPAGDSAIRESHPGTRSFYSSTGVALQLHLSQSRSCVTLHATSRCELLKPVPHTASCQGGALNRSATGMALPATRLRAYSCPRPDDTACPADLWRRVFLAGQPGKAGQADQAQAAAPEFGQPLEQNYKSLSNQDPSSLIFRARSVLPNPFAQLSSLPLRAKLPDLATPQKKPSRRRAAMPDLIEVNTPHCLQIQQRNDMQRWHAEADAIPVPGV